jgi:hypothetical protein
MRLQSIIASFRARETHALKEAVGALAAQEILRYESIRVVNQLLYICISIYLSICLSIYLLCILYQSIYSYHTRVYAFSISGHLIPHTHTNTHTHTLTQTHTHTHTRTHTHSHTHTHRDTHTHTRKHTHTLLSPLSPLLLSCPTFHTHTHTHTHNPSLSLLSPLLLSCPIFLPLVSRLHRIFGFVRLVHAASSY